MLLRNRLLLLLLLLLLRSQYISKQAKSRPQQS
jgi:hypothetical protein